MADNQQSLLNLNEIREKNHVCSLNSWCDNCAYCEFEYPNLKRRVQNATNQKELDVLNSIIQEKIKTSASKLESNTFFFKFKFISIFINLLWLDLRDALEEKLKNSAYFNSFDIEIMNDSFIVELDNREETNLATIDSYADYLCKLVVL